MVTYSRPRLAAIIQGWPWGQKLRTVARFWIESNKRGQRAGRVLTDPKTGRDCAPKFTTYSKAARIVDGDDGRTYIATLGEFNFSLHIWQGDMKHTQEYPPAGVAGTVEHARHAEILALFSAEALVNDNEGNDTPEDVARVAREIGGGFGAPAAEGSPIKGTSGAGGAA